MSVKWDWRIPAATHDVLDGGVADAADQVAPDVDAVDLGPVRLDVARRQAARVESEDLVVEPLERRCLLLTSCGSKLPVRSLGVSIRAGPYSLADYDQHTS